MKTILLLVLALASFNTLANTGSCIGNWPGTQDQGWMRTQQVEHKALHLAGSAAVTAGVAWATDSVGWGVAAGVTLGLARELQKHVSPGMRCEWSSMAFDGIGVALGAYSANRWLITPQKGGAAVAYNIKF